MHIAVIADKEDPKGNLFMSGSGRGPILIPELERFQAVSQSPPHRWNLLEHSIKTVEKLERLLCDGDECRSAVVQPIQAHLGKDIEEGVTRRSLLPRL